MIHVRAELWPKGDRSAPRPLGEMVIENVGGDDKVGNYRYSISKRFGFRDATRPRTEECWKQGELDGFPRSSSLGVWDLMLLCLGSALINRIKPLGSAG